MQALAAQNRWRLGASVSGRWWWEGDKRCQVVGARLHFGGSSCGTSWRVGCGGEGKGGIKGSDHQVSGLSSASVRLTFTERMGRATLVGKSGVPSWTPKWRCLLAIYEERTRRHLATGVWGSGLCQRVQGAALANSSTLLSVSFSLSLGALGNRAEKAMASFTDTLPQHQVGTASQ